MTDVLIEWLGVVLTAVLTGAVSVGVAFLQSRIRSERLDQALERLRVAAECSVYQLQQEFVDEWKKAGGKLSSEQVAALGRECLERTMKKMDEPAKALIESMGLDMQECIRGYVERTVLQIRETENLRPLP
jgi:hypothetical protein